jgi:hypothetical protein
MVTFAVLDVLTDYAAQIRPHNFGERDDPRFPITGSEPTPRAWLDHRRVLGPPPQSPGTPSRGSR